jgi:hypothetical protein
MVRSRIYGSGFTAQIRVATVGTGPIVHFESLLQPFDRVLRRATSIHRFVIHVETVKQRKEVVLSIAAVRHSATDRADNTILALLRRVFPEIERRCWRALTQKELQNESIYADYGLLPQDEAEAEMRRLQALKLGPDSAVSSTDIPISHEAVGDA